MRGVFESLEQRQLLAGDVVVNVVNGTLRIEGDIEANKILITADTAAEAGAFVVTGLDGTTLNDATDPVSVSGVRNIVANLGDGNDLVALAGAEVLGNVSIRTAEGDDRVVVGTAGGAVELDGELPEDLTVRVRGALNIGTGVGADQVAVDATTAGLLHVSAGEDNDTVSLGSTQDVGDLSARLAVRTAAHIDLGDGDDELNVDQVNAHGVLLIRAGLGSDMMDANVAEAKAMLAFGDGGEDAISLADLDVEHLGVHSGEGNDTVAIRDSVFANLGVGLGAGNDTLTTSALQARLAILGGGDGEDTLEEVSPSVFERQRILGFEIPPDINVIDRPKVRRLIGRLLGRL
jgi:hypothetical protein